ncbi:MAG: hypothetical protein ACUVSA_06490 [Desulfosoma sp.]|uniref:hypothetical protein n=1 Tax=Desulfosoma sp. TaxID=2603217 RepID=UPI00404991DC
MEICRLARKEKVDLIVIGPYTLHDPKAPLELEKSHLGQNAQEVSLRAPCQVSIVTSPKQRLALEKAEEHGRSKKRRRKTM